MFEITLNFSKNDAIQLFQHAGLTVRMQDMETVFENEKMDLMSWVVIDPFTDEPIPLQIAFETYMKMKGRNLFFTDCNKLDILNLFKNKLKIKQILTAVCKVYSLSIEEICSSNRRREYSEARQMFCYLSCEYTLNTLRTIGELIKRDHSTVLASRKRFEEILMYPEVKENLKKINDEIELERPMLSTC